MMAGKIAKDSQRSHGGRLVHVAEVNQGRWLERSGQWLENIDRTHLGLASGKPLLKTQL